MPTKATPIAELEAALGHLAKTAWTGCQHHWLPSALVPGRSFYCEKCRDWKVLSIKGDPNAR